MNSTSMHDVDWTSLLHRFNDLVRHRIEHSGDLPAAAPVDRRLAAIPTAEGCGLDAALSRFIADWMPGFSGSAGPRYFGFVTGGATPAALLGDWLASVVDQNAMGSNDSIAPQLEAEALTLVRNLIGLPSEQAGTFVSGATMANFVGLAIARQWIGEQHGIDVAQAGLQALPNGCAVFSGSPHSSAFKSLAMAGMGRDTLRIVPTLPGREAIDIDALKRQLEAHAQPCIVVANAGTVNSADFDDLCAILALKDKFEFWLHVDAAFGAYAGCSNKYRHLVAGLGEADSITIDAHKWLNVPYDCAVQFTRYPHLQNRVFNNSASYLPGDYSPTNFVHLTPENSRRLRALPVWLTLQAYGRDAYADMIERHCMLAQTLSEWIDGDGNFERLSPTLLNGLCFALRTQEGLASEDIHSDYLRRLADDGRVFLTPTRHQGKSAIRVSICNWQTDIDDLQIAWAAMRELHPATEHHP